MGKESGGGQSRIIFLLIIYVHLVTSQRPDDEAKAEEAPPPCPPSPPQLPYSSLNACPNHLITELLDALTCTPPPPPPLDDDGDLDPVSGMVSDQTVMTLSDAVVLALLKSRNADKGTPWEIVLFLMLPSAVLALQRNLLRNMYPRFVEVLEKLVAVLFVNGVMAFLLPAECFWVPLLCLSSSLLSLIIVPFLL